MKMTQNRLWTGLLLIGLMAMASFMTLAADARGKSDVKSRLDKNMKKWASKSITDYHYTFQRICYCAPDYTKAARIAVKNGQIETAHFADSGEQVDSSNFERYLTIEQLFELIQDALEKNAYKIEVSYDSKLGYPTSLFIDYDERMADEEMRVKIEKLAVGK